MPEIKIEYDGDMLFSTIVGNHTVKIDVPEVWGGKDRGLLPPQLFVISAASCIGAYVANYCKNAGLDASGMTISFGYEKLPDPLRLGKFKAIINLPNVKDEARKKAIIKSAEHCTVHESINHFEGVEMEVNLG